MPGEQGRTLSALTSGNVCCNYPFIWLGTTDLETPRLHNALARAATHSPGSNKKEREQEHQQRPARSTSPGTSAVCLLQRWCKQLPSSSCSSMACLSPLLGTHFATQILTRLKYQLRQICDLQHFLHLVFLSTETKSHFCPSCGAGCSCPGGFLQHLCTSWLLQLQLLSLFLVPSLGAARGVNNLPVNSPWSRR